ncbi:MAG: stage III sporulation protein AB [Oscillospiraceae bacterium]|nr:stage III sporulation protein AB [Oscillospiraceae bacterium]
MIRLLGAGLVAGGGLLLGLLQAERLTQQVRLLAQAAGDLEELARLLSWNGAPLSELLQALERRGGACIRGLQREDRQPFGRIWREALREFAPPLTEEGQAVLLEAGDILGRYDRTKQIEGLTACGKRLRQLTDEARETRRQMGRVYCVMGGTAGLLAAIVLI